MANEFEYFVLFAKEIPSSPAVGFTDEMDEDEIMIEELIKEIDVVKLEYDEPYPKKPVMVDFHDNGVIEIVSKKLYDILHPMKIKGIQLIPATVFDPKNRYTYSDYFYLHIYNYLKCLDMNNAKYTMSPGREGRNPLGTRQGSSTPMCAGGAINPKGAHPLPMPWAAHVRNSR